MISIKIMYVLLGFYTLLAIITGVEGKSALCLYWVGALILNVAVMRMAY